jgi:hypothetical protein
MIQKPPWDIEVGVGAACIVLALADHIPDRRQRREFLEGLMRKRQRVRHGR